MITKEDIKSLADLSRIELTPEELESLSNEAESILNYVKEVEKLSLDTEREVPNLRNIFREDLVLNESNKYKEKLLSNAPSREENYLKVKKIL